MNEEMKGKLKILDEYIDRMPEKKGALIEVLHQAQHIFGYLPEEVQRYVAQKIDVPVSKVFGTVTFYNYFTQEPRGKYAINVCLGTVCFVKGSDSILKEFEKLLGIKNEQCTEDGLFSLGGLRCVGACGIAPVVMVNDEVYGKFSLDKVRPLLQELKSRSLEKGGEFIEAK